jgi:hypothetical protein
VNPVPPRRFVQRLADFDPRLRCVWSDRRHCFQIQRAVDNRVTARRGKGYLNVLDVGPQLRAGGPTDIGSGDMILSRLRVMDSRARFRSLAHFQADIPQHEKDVARKDRHDEENEDVHIVHDYEDATRHRHHVPPTTGPIRSFPKP